MASATQGAACPPCGVDAVLCCRALVISTLQDAWQQAPRLEAANEYTAPQVFSTRKPRDAIAGLSSGFKTFARSVAAGSAALVYTPIEAAKEDGGILRTLQGVCEGVATAAVLPCAGAALATVQFTRGVALTPQAVVQALCGQQWNDTERCWKPMHYSLEEEAQHLKKKKTKNGGARRSRASSRHDGEKVRVHGREYYGLLRVNPTASYVEIRRAYYRESRRCHPDKAGTDPQMVERFQQLSQAYQVLRNADLRRAYDAGGQEAVARLSATIDLGSLYAAVLSGSQWEPYVGRFALSHILSGQNENAEADAFGSLMSIFFAEDPKDSWQAEREVRCAQTLVEKLRFVEDDCITTIEGFANNVRHEAGMLAQAPFAPAVLKAIAGVYEAEAGRFLGAFNLSALTLGREFQQTQSQGHLMLQQARAIGAGTQALLALRSLLADEASPSTEPASTTGEPRATALCLEGPAVQEQLPCLALALWQFTVLDVEGTLRRVCRRVLGDTSVTFECRRLRAEALQLMAKVLREVADAHGQNGRAGSPGDDKTLLLNKISEEAALIMSSRGQDGECAAGSTCSNDGTND